MHTLIADWLAGGRLALVAPFTKPRDLLAPALDGCERVILLCDTDLAALSVAAASGGGLLLRTTPRASRARVLTAPEPIGDCLLVTSVDALHSPILRRELREACGGAPWCFWRADRCDPSTACNGGRRPFAVRFHEQCGGGGWLEVHARADSAPVGAPVDVGDPGVLRFAAPEDQLAVAVDAGGAWLLGAAGAAERVGRQLGEGGVARRVHPLQRPEPRLWKAAEQLLREQARGADVLHGAGGLSAPGRLTIWLCAVSEAAELAAPAGGGVLSAAPVAVDDGILDAAEITAARRALRPGEAPWLAVPGALRAAPEELLADLQAVGVLAELRPTFLAARVSDQHRFQPPFVEKEPEYEAFHEAYSAAVSGWSLQERAELELRDRSFQDLRPLALRLGMSPADIADLLLALDDDGLITARLQPLRKGGPDWQALRGPAWELEDDEVAAAVNGLRQRRRARRVEFVAWAHSETCRLLGLRPSLGLDPGEPCGLCDVCDPATVAGLAALGSGAISGLVTSGGRAVENAPSAGTAAELDSLFAGLKNKPALPKAPPSPGQELAKGLRLLLKSATDEDLVEALGRAGSACRALVLSRLRYRPPVGAPELPSVDLCDRLFEALLAEVEPSGTAAGAGAPRLNRRSSGTVELRLPGGAMDGGVHRFELLGSALESDPDLIARLLRLDAAPSSPLGIWVAAVADRGRWTAWVEQARVEVESQLDRFEVVALLPDFRSSGLSDVTPTSGSLWSGLLGVAEGPPEAALDYLASLPDTLAAKVPGLDLCENLWLARAGSWDALWEAGLGTLRRWDGSGGRRRRRSARGQGGPAKSGTKPMDPARRLELHALHRIEHPEELPAGGLSAWLRCGGAGPRPDEQRLEILVGAISGGERRHFQGLDALLPEALGGALAEAALKNGALPVDWLSRVLPARIGVEDWGAVALVMVAATGGPGDAGAIWDRVIAGVGEHLAAPIERALGAHAGPIAQALAAAAGASREAQREQEQRREGLLSLARDGRLAEAAEQLLLLGPAHASEGLDAEEQQELQRLIVGVREQIGALLGRLAPAMVDDASAEARQAGRDLLAEAAQSGWIRPLIAMIRVQVRRNPHDASRAYWLAQALTLAGLKRDAERAWKDAAALAPTPEVAVERQFEGITAALKAGDTRRAVRWMLELCGQRASHALAAAIADIVARDLLGEKERQTLLNGLRQSALVGVHARAIRLLEGPRPS